MFLRSLSLLNFRNHHVVSLNFSSRFIIITGNNGTGKTNLLDAIHYLSMGKSYFHLRDESVVREGEDAFWISGTTDCDGRSDEIKVSFVKGNTEIKPKKNIFKNGKALRVLSELMGTFPVVMVCPQDMEIIAGGSDYRRQFVNEMVSHVSREYLEALIGYRKILLQRNQYLKSISGTSPADPHLLEAYDKQLESYASELFRFRESWLQDFSVLFKECYRFFSPLDESPSMKWKFSATPGNFYEKLQHSLVADQWKGYTSVGPHKDDLAFYLNGKPLKPVASQGQQKSFLLALKMAKHLYLLQKTGKVPPLLLDDIYDKLDELRFRRFMEWLNEHTRAQVFITDTLFERMKILNDRLGLNADFVNTNNGVIFYSGDVVTAG
ncbi:MAG: DNA replication and repair protein RecF [Bacteroidia bacterium]|nr:DNA replication and repair protein RecF [Bacteroidia bacterium]